MTSDNLGFLSKAQFHAVCIAENGRVQKKKLAFSPLAAQHHMLHAIQNRTDDIDRLLSRVDCMTFDSPESRVEFVGGLCAERGELGSVHRTLICLAPHQSSALFDAIEAVYAKVASETDRTGTPASFEQICRQVYFERTKRKM